MSPVYVIVFLLMNDKLKQPTFTVAQPTAYYQTESDCWYHAGLVRETVEKRFEKDYNKIAAACLKADSEIK